MKPDPMQPWQRELTNLCADWMKQLPRKGNLIDGTDPRALKATESFVQQLKGRPDRDLMFLTSIMLVIAEVPEEVVRSIMRRAKEMEV